MLDAFIIDELRRREQGEREETIRPRLELPLEDRRPPPNNGNGDRRDDEEDDADRGVVIIDL